ncbi:MAG TPA: MFS transporter [Casimicrobiaceae bacterium]|nr:MFS transporter [Casimicrobiaceae bacterium]
MKRPEYLSQSPLRHKAFRVFYAGAIGTALGYTMQTTVAAWLMATLSTSPVMVALVQTASTAPALVFGLVGGAMADIVDRRKVILATQAVLIAATALLGVLTIAGWVGPALLLALTFLVGAGFAFYQPAQQASVNDLVSRAELSQAVSLNAVAFNVSRAIGPALAGAVTAWLGSGSALIASAAFFGIMTVAVRTLKPRESVLPGVPERLLSGVQIGLRYARHSPSLRAFILRTLAFTACASALWALLPVIARDQLGLGAGGYGFLFGMFGIGAVAGAVSIPHQLRQRSLNRVVYAGTVLWAMASLLIASSTWTALAAAGTFFSGAAWVTVHASLSAGTQSSVPGWVRARAVAMNLVAVQACLALGSPAWGVVASWSDTRVAIAVSAVMLFVLIMLVRDVRVRMGSEADVTPGSELPALALAAEPEPDDGPVLIQIEYQVDAADREEFLRAIAKVGPTRQRNGATSWRVFRDLETEGRFVERYIIESWAEYVRLRSRMTVADRALQQRAQDLQKPGVPVRVSRFLGVQ